MLTISQVSTPRQIDAIRSLIREFTGWATRVTDDSDHAPAFDDLEQYLANLPGEFSPPGGCLLLATADDEPAGCVAFWAVGDGTVELKRLYVRPRHRGKKIGAHLMATLIAEAKARKQSRIVLDTYYTMTAAHALYRNVGFRVTDAPRDFPEQWKSRVVFMELPLA